MSAAQDALQRLQETPAKNDRIRTSGWTQTGNTTNEHTLIASYQAQRPIAVREAPEADVHIVAYDSFTANLGGSDQDSYSLNHDIVDAASVADDIVLYQGTSAVSADSVDYSNNTFQYTDNGSGDELHAYYIVADQARLEFRKTAPLNVHGTLMEIDAGFANRREQTRDPVTFDFDSPVDAIVPTDWTIEVYIDAPYSVQWEDDSDTAATPDNMLIEIPIRRVQREIEGLDDVVRSVL